jgi:uncharacterized phage protein (predicted DNA packaging)
MYIYLEDCKKHLNVDKDFLDDDMYIASLIEVAEKVVEKDIDTRLADLEDEDGDIPSPLKQAMLLLIGNFYANRESVAYTNMVKVPYSYQYLIDLYKNYRGRNLKKDRWLWCKLQHNKKVNPENDAENNDVDDDEQG